TWTAVVRSVRTSFPVGHDLPADETAVLRPEIERRQQFGQGPPQIVAFVWMANTSVRAPLPGFRRSARTKAGTVLGKPKGDEWRRECTRIRTASFIDRAQRVSIVVAFRA